jgi:hypothetical protein
MVASLWEEKVWDHSRHGMMKAAKTVHKSQDGKQ